MLYLANGDLRDFEKSREIKISLRESSLTNFARSHEKNRIGASRHRPKLDSLQKSVMCRVRS